LRYRAGQSPNLKDFSSNRYKRKQQGNKRICRLHQTGIKDKVVLVRERKHLSQEQNAERTSEVETSGSAAGG
jgi:hypothetical protein